MWGIAYCNIDQSNAGEEIRVGIRRIHEGVLAPITHHKTQTHDGKWENKDEKSGARINVGIEQVDGDIVAEFPESRFEGKFDLALPPEIQRELQPDQKDESAHVARKVEDAVSVVEHGGAQVVLAVALDVVVFDMVVVVRVPSMAHHGIKYVGEEGVEEIIA